MPNQVAELTVLTTGTESSGTVSDTEVLDDVHHEHTDDAGALDLYYQFDIEPDGVPNNVIVTGRLNGVGDDLDGVFGFDFGTSTWDRVGDFIGQGSVNDITRTFPMLTRHVGTGANRGKVRFRFLASSGLTSAVLAVDQICVDFDVVVRSPGYEDGAIWVNTNGSNSSAVAPFDGTSDNPVNSWANALIVSAAKGTKRFRIENGSLIKLTGASDDFTLVGEAWSLDLNGQSIAGAHFAGSIDVVGTGTGGGVVFAGCVLAVTAPLTIGPCLFERCGLAGAIGFNASDAVYTFNQCFSRVSPGVQSVDTGLAVGDVVVNVRHHSGELELFNLGQSGDDVIALEGHGSLIIAPNCVGGTVTVIGDWAVTNNSGGLVNVIFDDDTNALTNLKRRTPPAFRGVAFPDIPFLLVRKADGRTPVTAAIGLTAEVQIDGGSYVTASNTPTEASDGMYNYDASASDMAGAKITFRFTASNGTPGEPGETFVTILTGDAP